MTKPINLSNMISELARRERTSMLKIIIYAALPLLCVIIIGLSYVASTAQEKARTETASREELERQVEGLMNGPVRAYTRPGIFVAQLVTAKDLQQARSLMAQAKAGEAAWISNAGIRQHMDQLAKILDDEDNLDAARPRLEKEGYGLAKSAGDAWHLDTKDLPANTARLLKEKLYTRTIETTRAIANARQFSETATLRDEFWGLYWGELPLIEPPQVITAMVNFGKALNQWTEGPQPSQLKLDDLAEKVEKSMRVESGPP